MSLAVGRNLAHAGGTHARRLAIELGLALLSAALFRAFSDTRLIGDRLAVWSFWLVQSSYPLLERDAAPRDASPGDRFEAAAAAADRLMQS